MNERETKLAQIEQNQADRQRLIDEGNKLNAELANLDKPKLRHGDYGYGEAKWPRLTLKADSDKMFSAGNNCCEAEKDEYQNHPTIILGNIFDDLKRNSEDLEEFEVKSKRTSGKFRAKLQSVDKYGATQPLGATPELIMWLETECGHVSIEEAAEIHQKLGQLIATAKRRAK